MGPSLFSFCNKNDGEKKQTNVLNMRVTEAVFDAMFEHIFGGVIGIVVAFLIHVNVVNDETEFFAWLMVCVSLLWIVASTLYYREQMIKGL